MSNEIQQKFNISKDMQHDLSYALAELFFGLTRSNWTQSGQMLGGARQKAMEQIASFLAAKDSNNPAVIYLRQMFAERRAGVSKSIMQSNRSTLNLPTNQNQGHGAYGAKWVNSALQKLNRVIKEAEKSMSDRPKNIAPLSHEQVIRFIQSQFLGMAREH